MRNRKLTQSVIVVRTQFRSTSTITSITRLELRISTELKSHHHLNQFRTARQISNSFITHHQLRSTVSREQHQLRSGVSPSCEAITSSSQASQAAQKWCITSCEGITSSSQASQAAQKWCIQAATATPAHHQLLRSGVSPSCVCCESITSSSPAQIVRTGTELGFWSKWPITSITR